MYKGFDSIDRQSQLNMGYSVRAELMKSGRDVKRAEEPALARRAYDAVVEDIGVKGKELEDYDVTEHGEDLELVRFVDEVFLQEATSNVVSGRLEIVRLIYKDVIGRFIEEEESLEELQARMGGYGQKVALLIVLLAVIMGLVQALN